jgi:hypothetical protein
VAEIDPAMHDYEARRCCFCDCRHPSFGFGPPMTREPIWRAVHIRPRSKRDYWRARSRGDRTDRRETAPLRSQLRYCCGSRGVGTSPGHVPPRHHGRSASRQGKGRANMIYRQRLNAYLADLTQRALFPRRLRRELDQSQPSAAPARDALPSRGAESRDERPAEDRWRARDYRDAR